MSKKSGGGFRSFDSLESKSVESLGIGAANIPLAKPHYDAPSPKLREFTNSKLEPEGGAPIDEYIYNCIGYVIYCPKHQKVVLNVNQRSKAVWLPFVASPHNKTWSDATTEGISFIFQKDDSELDPRLVVIPVRTINCLHVLRIQLPITRKFIYRLIQLITLGQNTQTFQCCQNSSKHSQWIDVNEAIGGNIVGLWGPEVPMFTSYIKDQRPQEITEYGLDQVISFYPKDQDNGKDTEEEQMIRALNIKREHVEQVYSDFLEHCFPSFYMTYWSFCSYLNDYIQQFDSQNALIQMFQAFNYNRTGYLSFHQFFFGIVSIEPDCPNNETRLKFVFRYYDVSKDDSLSQDEFQQLMKDLYMPPRDIKDVLSSLNFPIDWWTFLTLSKTLKTSNLCRSSSPLIKSICENFTKRNETRISASKHDLAVKRPDKSKGNCLNCRERKYEFGSHCVRFDPLGRCTEPRHILDDNDDVDIEDDGNDMTMTKYSQDYIFSTISIGHTFLDMIREFNAQSPREKTGFFASEIDIFISYVRIICQNVRSLLECEEKLIKINSSAYALGNILGDLNSLLVIEGALWQSVPVLSTNYVLLGNYVNVGKWGIECLLYLFALKIVAPNKFFLLRGSNEISNKKNIFQTECVRKYGPKNGGAIFDIITEVFDRMPLAVIIDESIFCVNTGVPPSELNVDEFYNLPRCLKDPTNNPIAREVLTNTRCTDEQILEYLDKNQLSFLIRTNQNAERGFSFQARQRCVNLNSMANTAELTVLCIHECRIQVVKINCGRSLTKESI